MIIPTPKDAAAIKADIGKLANARGGGVHNTLGGLSFPPKPGQRSELDRWRPQHWQGQIYGTVSAGVYQVKLTHNQSDASVQPWGSGDPRYQVVNATNLDEEYEFGAMRPGNALPIGQTVTLFWTYSTDSNPPVRTWYFFGRGPQIFPVDLTQDNGAGHAGDGSTQCTFTYTVKISATTIRKVLTDTGGTATTINPTTGNGHWKRPSVGAMIAADFGLAFYDSSGNLQIAWCNEQIDVASLETGGTSGFTGYVQVCIDLSGASYDSGIGSSAYGHATATVVITEGGTVDLVGAMNTALVGNLRKLGVKWVLFHYVNGVLTEICKLDMTPLADPTTAPWAGIDMTNLAGL